MGKLRWTPQAADDLESITDLIAVDSVHYASLFALDVMAAVERIADFPRAGKIVPEFSESRIRQVVVGSYRIIYRHDNDVVVILTVYHGARLLDRAKIRE